MAFEWKTSFDTAQFERELIALAPKERGRTVRKMLTAGVRRLRDDYRAFIRGSRIKRRTGKLLRAAGIRRNWRRLRGDTIGSVTVGVKDTAFYWRFLIEGSPSRRYGRRFYRVRRKADGTVSRTLVRKGTPRVPQPPVASSRALTRHMERSLRDAIDDALKILEQELNHGKG